MTTITYSTGTYSDNTTKQVPGAAFALMAHGNGKHSVKHKVYDAEGTYMSVWMSGVADQLERIVEVCDEIDDLKLNIVYWNSNIDKIIAKVYGVFSDIKGSTTLNDKLLTLKLRKANKQLYSYHDDMVRIVKALYAIHNATTFVVSFTPRNPTGEFGLAQQEAQLMIEELLEN